MVALEKERFHSTKVLDNSVEWDSERFQELLGGPQNQFHVHILSQPQSVSVLNCWNLLRRRWQKMLVSGKSSGQLQIVSKNNF